MPALGANSFIRRRPGRFLNANRMRILTAMETHQPCAGRLFNGLLGRVDEFETEEPYGIPTLTLG
jgi:hypothetical protein